jgi:hypothetical protein
VNASEDFYRTNREIDELLMGAEVVAAAIADAVFCQEERENIDLRWNAKAVMAA